MKKICWLYPRPFVFGRHGWWTRQGYARGFFLPPLLSHTPPSKEATCSPLGESAQPYMFYTCLYDLCTPYIHPLHNPMCVWCAHMYTCVYDLCTPYIHSPPPQSPLPSLPQRHCVMTAPFWLAVLSVMERDTYQWTLSKECLLGHPRSSVSHR